MSSPSDPIRKLATARRAAHAAIALTLLGVAGWAAMPLKSPGDQPEQRTALAAGADRSARTVSAFDAGAFDRTLWYVPPPAPPAPPPPKPPEMPRLELVGILRGGELRALIVDGADNELRTVSVGDAFGVTEILAITETGVRCRAHGREFELSLDHTNGGPP